MKTVYGNEASVYVDHDGLIHETANAKLFNIHNEEIWIPISVIEDEGDNIVAVKAWWASKNGLESDYK